MKGIAGATIPKFAKNLHPQTAPGEPQYVYPSEQKIPRHNFGPDPGDTLDEY